jgi:hypothetical protein
VSASGSAAESRFFFDFFFFFFFSEERPASDVARFFDGFASAGGGGGGDGPSDGEGGKWMIDDERNPCLTLHGAIWEGNYWRSLLLLDLGADIEARLNQVSPPDRTPLMRGADRARSCPAERVPVQLALLRLLLSRGADLRAKDRYGHTAIQIAGLGTPARALLSDVKAAGGWRSYVHRDRRRLLVLRVLCEKGRASTSDGLLARLFPPQATDDDVETPVALDGYAFRHVFSFWPPLPDLLGAPPKRFPHT